MYDQAGEYLHRPDLSWQEYKTAVDYDGAHHLTDDEHRRRLDITRKAALPRRTVERVRRTLRERGSP